MSGPRGRAAAAAGRRRCPERAEDAARRAARLLRWYPKTWRSRYGEEFTELLIADIGERPRSASRTADVIRGGLVARLAVAGLAGTTSQARASLASLACCAAVFLGFGGAMWSQLTIGWQWSPPDTAATAVATVAMSGAMLVVAVLTLLAALPVAWSVVSRMARGHRGLAGPSALFLAGLVIAVVVACAVAGAATAVRRTELSPRVLRLETRLGTAACAMMAVFLGACWAWVADRVPGPGNLFRAGTIDVAGVAVMTVALAAGWQAARHARRAARQTRAAAA